MRRTANTVESLSDALFAASVLVPLAWIGNLRPEVWATAHAASVVVLFLNTFAPLGQKGLDAVSAGLHTVALAGDALLLLVVSCNLTSCCVSTRAGFFPGFDVCETGLSTLLAIVLLVAAALSALGSAVRVAIFKVDTSFVHIVCCALIGAWGILSARSDSAFANVTLSTQAIVSGAFGVVSLLTRDEVRIASAVCAFVTQSVGVSLALLGARQIPGLVLRRQDSFSVGALAGLLATSAGSAFLKLRSADGEVRGVAPVFTKATEALFFTLHVLRGLASAGAFAGGALTGSVRLSSAAFALAFLLLDVLAVVGLRGSILGPSLAAFSSISVSIWGWASLLHGRWSVLPDSWAALYLSGVGFTLAWCTLKLPHMLRRVRLKKSSI